MVGGPGFLAHPAFAYFRIDNWGSGDTPYDIGPMPCGDGVGDNSVEPVSGYDSLISISHPAETCIPVKRIGQPRYLIYDLLAGFHSRKMPKRLGWSRFFGCRNAL